MSNVDKLISIGILPKNYQDELCEDFYIEFFGGLYEDLDFGGVNFHFPESDVDQVAFITCNLKYADLDLSLVMKLLNGYDIKVSDNFDSIDFKLLLDGKPEFQAIDSLSTISTKNYIGKSGGLVWCFYLTPEGVLQNFEAIDLKLIEDNNKRELYDQSYMKLLHSKLRGDLK